MGDRGVQLLEIAGGQISELASLLSTRGNAVLTLPCPGRGRLGDGTVGATALHTADSYRRIAAFLQKTVDARSSSQPASHGRQYRGEDVDLNRLLEQLSEAQGALSSLGGLSDEQLDEVPPASETRFCDGQRTLEQVLTSLLKHQRHQIEALKAAVT
jgi:hypothetical protein